VNNSDYMEMYHNLFATMRDLYHVGKQQGFLWDLHTENVMRSSWIFIVITDLYWNRHFCD